MSSIPKIAHVAWKTKDVVDSKSPLIVNGLRKLIDLNPDWTVTVHDDNDVDEYLIDRFYNIPLSEIITDGIKCVLPTCLEWDFSQDFMLTEPKNPIQAKTIELILQRRYEGHKNVFFLGPQTYMHAVTTVLFGEMINTDPGVEKFTEMRKYIEQIPFIKTYREHPPHDTIIYKGDGDIDWEKLKKEFYAEANIKHWSGEW